MAELDVQKAAKQWKDNNRVRAVRVGHGYYGCESGCCGSEIQLLDSDGDDIGVSYNFDFLHGYDDQLPKAQELATALNVPLIDDAETRRRVVDCW